MTTYQLKKHWQKVLLSQLHIHRTHTQEKYKKSSEIELIIIIKTLYFASCLCHSLCCDDCSRKRFYSSCEMKNEYFYNPKSVSHALHTNSASSARRITFRIKGKMSKLRALFSVWFKLSFRQYTATWIGNAKGFWVLIALCYC